MSLTQSHFQTAPLPLWIFDILPYNLKYIGKVWQSRRRVSSWNVTEDTSSVRNSYCPKFDLLSSVISGLDMNVCCGFTRLENVHAHTFLMRTNTQSLIFTCKCDNERERWEHVLTFDIWPREKNERTKRASSQCLCSLGREKPPATPLLQRGGRWSSDPGNDGGSGVRLCEGTGYVCRAREERLGTRARRVIP